MGSLLELKFVVLTLWAQSLDLFLQFLVMSTMRASALALARRWHYDSTGGNLLIHWTIVVLAWQAHVNTLLLLRLVLVLHALESISHLFFHWLAKTLAFYVRFLKPLFILIGFIQCMLQLLPLWESKHFFLLKLSFENKILWLCRALSLIKCLWKLVTLKTRLSCILSQLFDFWQQQLSVTGRWWGWQLDIFIMTRMSQLQRPHATWHHWRVCRRCRLPVLRRWSVMEWIESLWFWFVGNLRAQALVIIWLFNLCNHWQLLLLLNTEVMRLWFFLGILGEISTRLVNLIGLLSHLRI